LTHFTQSDIIKKKKKGESKMGEKGKKIQRKYTKEYKEKAVKLSREIGKKRAAEELGIPWRTVYDWERIAKAGGIDLGSGGQTPQSGLTLAGEIQKLKAENKRLEKENRELKKTNDFLEEASTFFAASRQKYTKKNDLN
jgi:transposase